MIIEGSLRYNLDPINQYSDEEIIEVVNDVGLSYLLIDRTLDFIV